MRQKFTGYERDSESGLDYAKARMFDSVYGRFTSPDPLRGSGKPILPQSWNLYVYVMNNPLIAMDPSGMLPVYWHYDKKLKQTTFSETWHKGWHRYRGDSQILTGVNGNRFVVTRNGIRDLPAENTASNTSRPQSQAHSPASLASSVNHDMVNSIANHTEPVPRFLGVLAGAGVAGGVACVVLCPSTAATLTTIGVGGADYAATHPDQTEEALEGVTIQFGRVANQVYHTFRHIDELGLDRSEVQTAVENDLQNVASQIPVGQLYTGYVQVGGQTLQYNAYRLADGTINVGRIHEVP